jgi:hypothetical protein
LEEPGEPREEALFARIRAFTLDLPRFCHNHTSFLP